MDCRKLLVLLALLFAPAAIFAQANSVVTATVVDANGNKYTGTVSAQLILNIGQPIPPGYKLTTGPVPMTAGAASITVIFPGTYIFTFCGNPVNIGPFSQPTPIQVCFSTGPIAITASAVNITSQLGNIPLLGPGGGTGGTSTFAWFTFASLPVAPAVNSTFGVLDCLTIACTAGGGTLQEFVRWTGSAYVVVPNSLSGCVPTGIPGDVQTQSNPTGNCNNSSINDNGTLPGNVVIGNNVVPKGPNPYVSITNPAFGNARFINPNIIPSGVVSASASSTSVTCVSGCTSYRNGDSIAIVGAGQTQTMSAVGAITVTPTSAIGPTGTGLVTPMATAGSTPYCYSIEPIDAGRGVGLPGSQVCTAIGPAALGSITTNIIAGSYNNNTIVYNVGSTTSLSPGSLIYSSGTGANGEYGGWKVVLSITDTTHFVAASANDARLGVFTSSVAAGTIYTWVGNTIGLPQPTDGKTHQYAIFGRTAGSQILLHITYPIDQSQLNSDSTYLTWTDYGPTMQNLGGGTKPTWDIPNTPLATAQNDVLSAVICSGGGTASITLCNPTVNAVSSVPSQIDASPAWATAQAFASFTVGGGGTPYIPALQEDANSDLCIPISTPLTLNRQPLIAGPVCVYSTITSTVNILGVPYDANRIDYGQFGFEGFPPLYDEGAVPAFWMQSGAIQNLTLHTFGNDYLGVFVSNTQPPPPALWEHFNFQSNLDPNDYMGIFYYLFTTQIASGGFSGKFQDFSMNSGPAAQADGLTSTPAWISKASNYKWTINQFYGTRRGFYFGSASVEMNIGTGWQGGITPLVMMNHPNSGTLAGSSDIGGGVLDTMAENLIAILATGGGTFGASIRIHDMACPSSGMPLVGGLGAVTVKFDNSVCVLQQLGQNATTSSYNPNPNFDYAARVPYLYINRSLAAPSPNFGCSIYDLYTDNTLAFSCNNSSTKFTFLTTTSLTQAQPTGASSTSAITTFGSYWIASFDPTVGDLCHKIFHVASSMPSTGGVIDANGLGLQQCTTAMLPNSSKGITVLLKDTQLQTTVQIQIPASGAIEGGQQGDATRGTVIQAVAGFPSNTAVVEFGFALIAQSIRVEHLTIDCNNQTGSIGLEDQFAQEGAYANEVTINNCASIGLNLIGTSGGAQNSGAWDRINVQTGTSATTATLCGKLNNIPSMRRINGFTCTIVPGYVSQPNYGLQIDGGGGGVIQDAQLQSMATAGIIIGSALATTGGVKIENLSLAGSVPTGVLISNANNVQHVFIFGVHGATTNQLNDQATGCQSGVNPLGTYILGSNSGTQYDRYVDQNASSCTQVAMYQGMGGRSIIGAATTDTIAAPDVNSVVNHDVAASGAVNETLPTATTLANPTFAYTYSNHSAQTDTITPTTWTIQKGASAAAATLSVPSGISCRIKVDPNSATNWLADCNATTSFPASAALLGTTAGSVPTTATAHAIEQTEICADSSGSGTAQVCNTSPTFTPATNDCMRYTTTTTNSGAALTINWNSLGAKSVAIPGSSGWTTTLTASIIPANKPLLACYDGTNINVVQTGTAAAGGGGISIVYSTTTASSPTGGTTNSISAITMVTPGANHVYEFSADIVQTAATVGCATQPTAPISIQYKDSISGSTTGFLQPAQVNLQVSGSYAAATTFTQSGGSLPQVSKYPAILIWAQSGTAVTVTVTANAGSGCTTGAAYTLAPILKQLQ